MTLRIFIIAFALALDAFAVSVSCGFCMKQLHVRHALRISLSFGFFQALMPVIGWLAGFGMKQFIQGVDHWIAFILLAIIGGKMIWESKSLNPHKNKREVIGNSRLFMLSIATSLDALAVGIILPFLQVSIIAAPVIIGIVTFSLCYSGIYLGNRFGHLFENKMEIIGGIVLILIGVEILIKG
ncbi:manganese efflux pump [Candidatus Sumerlaeota bacterium]|nr:manganese efflux pump [Candidatus Sumerlaeota bacterium]